MALSKKSSRPITVEGKDYRWIFFENSGWNDLTIQAASGEGEKLIVQIKWAPDDETGLPYMPVKPAFVARAIQFGLAEGWRPDERGGSFRCHFQDGAFLKA